MYTAMLSTEKGILKKKQEFFLSIEDELKTRIQDICAKVKTWGKELKLTNMLHQVHCLYYHNKKVSMSNKNVLKFSWLSSVSVNRRITNVILNNPRKPTADENKG